MELRDNTVLLNRKDMRALGVTVDQLPAIALEAVWSRAADASARDRAGIADDIRHLGNLGIHTTSIGGRLREIVAQEAHLGKMEQMVAGIAMETIMPDRLAEPTEDL